MDDVSVLNALRTGDETAFTSLVEQYHTSLVRLATLFVRDETVAEELAQETWISVLQGLNRFEGRSSLKTWIFTILTNKAKTRGQRENRTVVFSDFEQADDFSAVDASRFIPATADRLANHWAQFPPSWEAIPEEKLLSQETMHMIRAAIAELPQTQQGVIQLRDVEGVSSEEVCNILGISETNQRVLLHRARARVRQSLEEYFLRAEN